MRLPRAWKRWFDLRLVSGLFRAPVPWLEYVQDYFAQQYDSNGDPEPFRRGILAFAVGYCPARQIMEKCIRAPNPEGGIVRITEPDFLDALDWIDYGIREMSSSDRRKSKKEAIFYCCALGEFSAFLDLAGADEAALRCIEHSIEFGREYAARWTTPRARCRPRTSWRKRCSAITSTRTQTFFTKSFSLIFRFISWSRTWKRPASF